MTQPVRRYVVNHDDARVLAPYEVLEPHEEGVYMSAIDYLALEAERDALRADARRYQFLRADGPRDGLYVADGARDWREVKGDALDAAMDAAIDSALATQEAG